MRRLLVLTALAALAAVSVTASSQAAIHEKVASFCSGRFVQDPPGQLNGTGNSFLRALQASGIYTLQFGVDMGGTFGLDFTATPPAFGPLPEPPAGTTPITVLIDPTAPSAKVGDFLFWVFFVDGPFAVYLPIYELQHPAFQHCPKFSEE